MDIGIITLILITLLLEGSKAENSVLIKSAYSQLLTSTTLKWISVKHGLTLENAVIGSYEFIAEGDFDIEGQEFRTIQKKIYICRAYHNGAWIPGALYKDKQSCKVSLIGKVYDHKEYEVLYNVEGAARLIWHDWDKTQMIPVGAVSGGSSYYIAHKQSSKLQIKQQQPIGVSFMLGKIDSREGIFGKMTLISEDGSHEVEPNGGQVLVEREPMFYELTIESFDKKRSKIKSWDIILGQVILTNEDQESTEPMNVNAIVPYSWNYTSSWGQVNAVLKGLRTVIRFKNGTSVEEIKWGIPISEEKKELEKVESRLDYGTAVNVTIKGNISKIERPYTGKLLSVFNDSDVMSRIINGIWQQTTLTDVTIEFGSVYFIQNQSLVPTTSTTTTSTTSTTTTTTSLPFTNSSSTSEIPSTKIIPPANSTDEKMMGDGGEVSQLRKKDTDGSSQKSSANISILSNSILIITSIIILKIT